MGELTSINIENDICKFSVTDNGTGFDFKKVKNGLGLKSIRKRIKELAGNLVINSKPYIRTEISGNFKLIA